MKRAIVTYSESGPSDEVFLIRNNHDLGMYLDYLSKISDNFIEWLISSSIPVDRWDHILVDSPASASMAGAIAICKLSGDAPLFKYSELMDRRILNLKKMAINGSIIAVNDVGGFCNVEDKDVIEEWEWEPIVDPSHNLNTDSTHIMLENSPQVEPVAHEQLSAIDPNYSTIFRLRNYSEDDLTDVLKEFKEFGGNCAYIYTTGIDLLQMESYVNCIIKSGLENMIFSFSSGDEDRLQHYVNSLAPNSNVKFI